MSAELHRTNLRHIGDTMRGTESEIAFELHGLSEVDAAKLHKDLAAVARAWVSARNLAERRAR